MLLKQPAQIEVVPFLNLFSVIDLQKVKVDDRNAKGENARTLAMMYGYTKIASLIDSRTPRTKPGVLGSFFLFYKISFCIFFNSFFVALFTDSFVASNFPGHFEDLSSSEDSDSAPPRLRPSRNRAKGISIHDGPQAIAKFRVGGTSKLCGSVTYIRCPVFLTMSELSTNSEVVRKSNYTNNSVNIVNSVCSFSLHSEIHSRCHH